ncbi:hypothetical protein MmiHf6_03210 [Methanimicrococcus hongohii]|uniref:DUF7847 domain-containing protein n=1 Tax=Methanimicrococcus hongohii TaxID=3028295 RepID=A0AA96V0I8_9EURY|nr:hypothetical protein [Methanimicrococcus sp. Hf6]WNY23025.1 hypothetical protein MmiHf6_03210 [Methanimicrococcus sp. Hf6]
MFSLSTILSAGWKNLKSNPILLVPGILSAILSFVFIFAIAWALAGDLDAAATTALTSGVDMVTYLNSINFEAFDFGHFFLIFFVALILMFVCSAFIEAGLTGMVKEAVVTGKTKFGDLFTYGAKYFLRFILYTILLSLVIGIPIIILAVIMGFVVSSLTAGTTTIAVVSFLFLLLIFIAAILLSLFFYFVPYIIIVEDMGVIDSFKRSYHLFMDNKKNVFVFVLAMVVINFILLLLTNILVVVLDFIPVVGVFIALLVSLIFTSAITALIAAWGIHAFIELAGKDVIGVAYVEYAEITEE